MKRNQFAASLVFAATLAAAGTSFAAGPTNAEYYPFQDLATTTTTVTSTGAAVNTQQPTNTDARTMGARGQSVIERWEQEVKLYDKAGA